MKKYFPLFERHPEIVYLDNAATTQKPQMVIQWVADFLCNDYANIHRGLYALSERSELYYHESKALVAQLLNCSTKEVIYTYNATAAINLLAQSLVKSKILTKDDVVLLWVREHHANVLPWMSLAELIGFQVEFFGIDENHQIDWEDFDRKYTKKVKVVAIGQVSNVTGAIYDPAQLKAVLREDTFFIVDASQSVPNMQVDVGQVGADAVVFTWHKLMAQTGIGVLILKHHRIKALTPMAVGGGTIKDVDTQGFLLQSGAEKFEAWTPNIVGAVSLGYALKFIASLTPSWVLKDGIALIHHHEKKLTWEALRRFEQLREQVSLLWPTNPDQRVALFSFVLKENGNFNQIWEFFAEQHICIRCGGHCAYPLHKSLQLWGTCRMSAYLYNDFEDLNRFFERLEQLLDFIWSKKR